MGRAWRCGNVTVQVSSGREEEVGPVGSSTLKIQTDGETNIQKKELLSPLEFSFTHPGRDDFAWRQTTFLQQTVNMLCSDYYFGILIERSTIDSILKVASNGTPGIIASVLFFRLLFKTAHLAPLPLLLTSF